MIPRWLGGLVAGGFETKPSMPVKRISVRKGILNIEQGISDVEVKANPKLDAFLKRVFYFQHTCGAHWPIFGLAPIAIGGMRG